MSFELKISFISIGSEWTARTKRQVLDYLEALGRSDYVEGYIDGVQIELLQEELDSETTTEERMSAAAVVLYDDSRSQLGRLETEIKEAFPEKLWTEISEISDESWQRCWNEEFHPLETGRFWIVPLGHGSPTPRGLARIEIDAGDGAFGTGQHATTRAIIHLMENHFQHWRPKSLLDVGTGTGIYLVLAGKLGVSKLYGTEISQDLVGLAKSNCETAGVRANVFLSDHLKLPEKFDVVIANILVPVLHDLMSEMKTHLAPEGYLVIAGFVEKEEAPLLLRASHCGLKIESSSHELGWRCLVLRHA
jgi:ribosomal protein L11 methyltransferase